MRIASSPRLLVAAPTDKETRLKNFITEALAHREKQTHAEPVLIVVRNPDSPVAHALCAAMFESNFSFEARVIFGETNGDDRAALSLLDVSNAEFRVLGDPRFGAAHEQLVAGERVWTGDCLRRDPNKRDAFEIYHAPEAGTRTFAMASFGKLWAAARPLKPVKAADLAPEIIAAKKGDELGLVPGDQSR
jgi:hypothetical protein